MSPPAAETPGWNDFFRFTLELVMLASYAWFGGYFYSWPGGIAIPLVIAVLWGVFSVPNDPGRNPKAIVAIPGPIRFALELLLLGGGCAVLIVLGRPFLAIGVAALNLLHLAFAGKRTRWLLSH